MVGNLYSVYVNSQRTNSYSRINLGDDGFGSRHNDPKQRLRPDSAESSSENNGSLRPRNIVFDSANNHNKQQFKDVIERYQKRTVLFQMMETMGGTGTSDSMSGQFLDTYV